MSTKNTNPKIITPIAQPLSEISGHSDVAGVLRDLFIGCELLDGSPIEIAIHRVAVHPSQSENEFPMEKESHVFDEINILIGEDENSLEYLYELDGETMNISSPRAVFIPAGCSHRMKPLSGAGKFICIRLTCQGKALLECSTQ